MNAYNMVFVLGYDLLQDFLGNKVNAECDIAFEFCAQMYRLFLNSEYNDENTSEYGCLQAYVNTFSVEQLEKCYHAMGKYYYTFGTDENFPYQRGWVEVHANNWKDAHAKFRAKFPDRNEGILNCADYYSGIHFVTSEMVNDNLGKCCHEVIK